MQIFYAEDWSGIPRAAISSTKGIHKWDNIWPLLGSISNRNIEWFRNCHIEILASETDLGLMSWIDGFSKQQSSLSKYKNSTMDFFKLNGNHVHHEVWWTKVLLNHSNNTWYASWWLARAQNGCFCMEEYIVNWRHGLSQVVQSNYCPVLCALAKS